MKFQLYLCYVVVSVLAFGWYEVRWFYNIQSGVDLAGRYIDENTPKDSLVITGATADTTLLYNRVSKHSLPAVYSLMLVTFGIIQIDMVGRSGMVRHIL